MNEVSSHQSRLLQPLVDHFINSVGFLWCDGPDKGCIYRGQAQEHRHPFLFLSCAFVCFLERFSKCMSTHTRTHTLTLTTLSSASPSPLLPGLAAIIAKCSR